MDSKNSGKFEDISNSKSKTEQLTWIIVIAVAFICGLTVFLIMSAIFNSSDSQEEPTEPQTEETLSLDETNVKVLYNYVSYGTRGKRNDKFFKESVVTLNSFNNQERFYYALQFVKKSDLTSTGQKNSKGEIIYNLSGKKMDDYMKRFFGEKVEYSRDISYTYPFSFAMNGKNVGIISSSASDGYDIVFSKVEGNLPKDLVEPFYAKLVGAYREPDGTYRLEEKVIFTQLTMNQNGTYTVAIYKDYNHTQLIDTLTNESETSLKQDPITVDSYLERALTIQYHFAIYDSMLYFESSKFVTE